MRSVNQIGDISGGLHQNNQINSFQEPHSQLTPQFKKEKTKGQTFFFKTGKCYEKLKKPPATHAKNNKPRMHELRGDSLNRRDVLPHVFTTKIKTGGRQTLPTHIFLFKQEYLFYFISILELQAKEINPAR